MEQFKNGTTLTAEQLNSTVWGTKLVGKRISIVGDSISTFSGYIYPGNAAQYPDGNVASVDDTYWKMLIDKTGMVLGVNNAYAGHKASQQATTANINRLGENGTPDIILVNVGTNAYSQGGSTETVGEVDTTVPYPLTSDQIAALTTKTFADSYRTLLIRLQYAYPKAQIFCCSMVYSGHANKYRFFDNPYIEVIEQYCKLYGVHYVDMRKCGITQINAADHMLVNSGKIAGDYTHPNKAGHELMYQYLYNQILCNYAVPESIE